MEKLILKPFLGKAKKMAYALCLGTILLLGFKPIDKKPKLTLQINNVEKDGIFYVSICSKSAEWSDNGKYSFKFDAMKEGQNIFEITTVPTGNYAIAIYQDLNGNEKLDTNFLGIPKEPYGFSNNKIPIFSEPSFEKCKFEFNENNQQISINLL